MIVSLYGVAGRPERPEPAEEYSRPEKSQSWTELPPASFSMSTAPTEQNCFRTSQTSSVSMILKWLAAPAYLPEILMNCHTLSATPQRSEICLKFSVFHTLFGVKSCEGFRFVHPNPGKRTARKISPNFHAKFHDTFGREKREKIDSALLQGSCSDTPTVFPGKYPDFP